MSIDSYDMNRPPLTHVQSSVNISQTSRSHHVCSSSSNVLNSHRHQKLTLLEDQDGKCIIARVT